MASGWRGANVLGDSRETGGEMFPRKSAAQKKWATEGDGGVKGLQREQISLVYLLNKLRSQKIKKLYPLTNLRDQGKPEGKGKKGEKKRED